MDYRIGTIFYHGSPQFFERPKSGSYFGTFPTLSLAILTEKGNGYGYIYVYRAKEQGGAQAQRVVGGLFLTEPVDVDSLEAVGIDVPKDKLISRTDQFYSEFIFSDPEKYLELIMIYKVDIEVLRIRAAEVSEKYTIPADGEDILINEFMPNIDFINVNQ